MGATTYDAVFGCELAEGRKDRDGYVLWSGGRAHIVAWEQANGSVPDGLELDHLCRRRACCALIHLEPVTRAENERRKSWAFRSRIERCPRGHLLAETAMVNGAGGRCCRTCRDEACGRHQVTVLADDAVPAGEVKCLTADDATMCEAAPNLDGPKDSMP